MKTKLLFLFSIFNCFAFGQLLIPNATPVTENFDGLGATNTAALPTGFRVNSAANYLTVTSVVTQAAGTSGVGALTGTSSGGTYNFANGITASSTDRALGFLSTGSFSSPRFIILEITNTNASPITTLNISFDYEKYRTGTRAFDFKFFHGSTATSVNTPETSGDQAYTSDAANAVVNPPTSISKVVTLLGLNIASGASYYLCWNYIGSGGSSNAQGLGLDNFSLTASYSTTCTTPTTQSSAFAIANINNVGADFSWTNAAGTSGSMLVIRPTVQANVLPAATNYTPNISYATAGQIDTNNRVLVRGSGTSVTGISGLTPATQYTSTIYAYNDPNSCYNTATPESINFYTLANEPTAHPASFGCNVISNSQINLNFSAASTVGAAGYLILYKEASAITGLPSDGANYPVTTIIGDATVLAQTNATDTSFNATGLNGGTTYYFRLIPFGFNGLNNETYNYRTAATVQSTFCATVVAPEINIKGVIASNPSIPDNTTTTSGLNNTLFGSVVIGNTQSKVFRIENTGNADLIISNISFVGGNAADFSFLGISFPLNLGSASFFDFTVVFTPSVAGTLTTTININSNDSNEAVYDFVLKGTGTINSLVEINLKGNGSSIADNSIYPTGLNHTLFPVTNVGATFDRVFTIENLGSTNLNLTGTPIVTITGVAAGSFSVFVQPSSNTIAGGSSLTFTIRFSPTALGSKNATINILSNDGDESLYNFNISGNAKGINNVYVYGNGNDVLKGSTTTSTANNTNFGGVSITGGIKQNTFVIANYSTVAVYISNLVISGPNASMFSVSNLPINDALGAGNSTSFTINFSPTSVGFKNATLTFNVWLNSTLTTPDSIDPVVSFALSGLGNNFINCTKGPNQTIAQQDFEITPATPTWGFNAVGNDATEYHLITNGTAFGTGTGQNKFLGANSFQFKPLVAGTQRFSTIYLDPIDASLYKDVNFSMRVAPYCTTSNNGLDVNDFVNIEVSTDGGVNWTLEAQLNGFNNSRYEMLATGQKIFNTFYTGSNSGVSVNTKAVPSCIGTSCAGTKDSSGNYAFSQINLNNLPSIADLRIRIIVTSDNVTEIWAIDNIKIEGKIPVQATWTSTGWLPGGTAPTQSTKAVIDFLYDTSINGNIETCECEIKSGKTLEVKNSGYVEVQGDFLNYGTLNVSNNSSFVQLNDNALNIGTANNITRITSQFEKFDYIYWSSPVVGTTLNNNFNTWNKPYSFSFNTSTYLDLYSGLGYPQVAGVPDGFDDDGNVWSILGLTTPFVPAKGYIIMAPKTGSFPRTEVVLFSGEMNNGIKTFPLQLSQNTANNLDDYNLVGNPYPSAISADSFIKANIQPIATTNNITGTILFWTHKGDVQPFTTNPGPNIINYSSDDYAYYNLSGPVASGLGTASISGSLTPNGFIASGQGFFVEAETTNDLVFNNSMRSKTFDNSRFFRTANALNVNNTTNQKDRIWLNLQNTDSMFSQLLIAYLPDTTLNFDYGFDSRNVPAFNYLSFYSHNGYDPDNFFKIQSRSDFNENDSINIGYSSAVSGTTNISIDRAEGIINEPTTNVYLEDNLLNITHDLKAAPYVFTTNYGTFNDRFVLKYVNNALANDKYIDIENQVKIGSKNQKINVISNTENLGEIEIYDLIGRRIFSQNNINKQTILLENINANNQALIIKIKLENGVVVTRKIIIE